MPEKSPRRLADDVPRGQPEAATLAATGPDEVETTDERRQRLLFVERNEYMRGKMLEATQGGQGLRLARLDPEMLTALPARLRAVAQEAEAEIHRHVRAGENEDARRVGKAAAEAIAGALDESWEPPAGDDPSALAAQVPRH